MDGDSVHLPTSHKGNPATAITAFPRVKLHTQHRSRRVLSYLVGEFRLERHRETNLNTVAPHTSAQPQPITNPPSNSPLPTLTPPDTHIVGLFA